MALSAMLLLPAGALALTGSITDGAMLVTSASNEQVDLTITVVGADYVINPSSSTTLTVGVGCTDTGTTITCPTASVTGRVIVRLGDASDVLRLYSAPDPFLVNLGAGDDQLWAGGTPTDIRAEGGPGEDVIATGTGFDKVWGGDGDDMLDGGDGDDDLYGGAGDDLLLGRAGQDELFASGGADIMDGGDGTDQGNYYNVGAPVRVTIDERANDGRSGEGDNLIAIEVATGGAGNDVLDMRGVTGGTTSIIGGSGHDTLIGASTLTSFWGGNGNDVLIGGAAGDNMSGDAGDDTLRGGGGADSFFGGAGNDTVSYSDHVARVVATLGTPGGNGSTGEDEDLSLSLERLIGGMAGDSLTGTAGADRIDGGPGNDSISGLAGADLLIGGRGLDALLGGADNDTLRSADGARDVVNGGTGTDTAYRDFLDSLLGIEVRL